MGNNLCAPRKGDTAESAEDLRKKEDDNQMYKGPINSNLSMRSFITQALPKVNKLQGTSIS